MEAFDCKEHFLQQIMKNNVKNNTNIFNYLGEVRGIDTFIQCHVSRIILLNINCKNHRMSKNLREKGIEELRGKKELFYFMATE